MSLTTGAMSGAAATLRLVASPPVQPAPLSASAYTPTPRRTVSPTAPASGPISALRLRRRRAARRWAAPSPPNSPPDSSPKSPDPGPRGPAGPPADPGPYGFADSYGGPDWPDPIGEPD